MPDACEDAHNQNKLVNDAGLDPDHDGFTNLQEYLAGTDPHDGASFLRFESVGATAGGYELHFVAVAGRTYSVQHRDAFGSGEWQKRLDVPAQATTQVIVITDSAGLDHSERFYRLVTPQMP